MIRNPATPGLKREPSKVGNHDVSRTGGCNLNKVDKHDAVSIKGEFYMWKLYSVLDQIGA